MAEMTKEQAARKQREERLRKQKEAKAKAEAKTEAKIESAAKPQLAQDQRDWSSDLGGLIKGTGGAAKSAAKVAADLLVDKKAWKNTAQAIADGRGGKEVRGRDLANMALDASILIPGAGLAGGAARIGARQALKYGEREVAGTAASQLTGMAAQVAERKAAAGGARIAGKDAVAAGGKHVGPAGLGSGKGVGRHSATAGESTKLDLLLNEGVRSGKEGLQSLATRATRARSGVAAERAGARVGGRRGVGNGTRVGFNQSKKRVAANALIAGGLNAGGSAYNSLVNGGGKDPNGGLTAPGEDGIIRLPGGPGAATGYYFLDASGESTPMPEAMARAVASAYAMGGSPDGSQVIYMGRG